MTDRIEVTGIEVFGHHGVLPHERIYGQRFVVDLVLEVDLRAAGSSDALDDTVDYGALTADVLAIAGGEPVDLIERLAERIAGRCLQDDRVEACEVAVHKPAAPVPAVVAEVAVRIRRERP